MKYIIHCSDIFHRNKPCILLSFEKSDTIHAKFKKLQFVKFSKTHGSWYMPKNKHQFEVLKQSLQHIATFKTQIVFSTTNTPTPQKQPLKVLPPPAQVNTALTPSPAKAVAKIELSTNNIQQLQLFIQQLQLKAYSHNTITTYRNEFIALLQILKNTPVQSLSTQRIKDYLQYCFVQQKLSENTIHSRMNALHPVGLKNKICTTTFMYY